MSDNHAFLSQYGNRYAKKRGSVDTDYKTFQKKQRPKQLKQKGVAELSIDLNTHKNNKSISMNKNFTHRPLETKNNNLCDLRQQVEQLRMENESLREEIKSYKNNQAELKYKIRKLESELEKQVHLKNNLNKQYQNMEQKLKNYTQKIKQLFQNLIHQKKKNAGLNPTISKIKMALSPSNSSISNSLNLRKYQQQGEQDYFNFVKRTDKTDYLKINNHRNHQKNGRSIESFENSPSQGRKATRGIIGMPQTFGTRY